MVIVPIDFDIFSNSNESLFKKEGAMKSLWCKITLAGLLSVQSLLAVNPDHSYLDRCTPSRVSPVENPPMLIVMGSDDNFNTEGMEWMLDVLSKRKHKDGSNLRMSFYCNTRWSDISDTNALFKTFKKAYDMGNEVTSHTATHIKCAAPVGSEDRLSDDSIYTEIMNNIDDLERIGIKREHMFGFRTPYLAITDSTYIAVQRAGFDYDCSAYEGQDQILGARPGNFRWPFTIDTKNDVFLSENGLELPPLWWDPNDMGELLPIEPSYIPGNHLAISNNNRVNRAPIRKHSGLWELPVYCIYAPDSLVGKLDTAYGYQTGGIAGEAFDVLLSGDTTGQKLVRGAAFTREQGLETLTHHFDAVYNGNRSPMTILFHTQNFSPTTGNDHHFPRCTDAKDRQWMVEQFVDYALSKDNVWFVSGEQAINYCKNPVSAENFKPDSYSAIEPLTTKILPFYQEVKSSNTSISYSNKKLRLQVSQKGVHQIEICSLNGKLLKVIKEEFVEGVHDIVADINYNGIALVRVLHPSGSNVMKVACLK